MHADPKGVLTGVHFIDGDHACCEGAQASRVAQRALQFARARGVSAGSFRIITAWPFPEQPIRHLARRVKAFVVPELNLAQMFGEVERIIAGKARVISVTHAGGTVHDPDAIFNAIKEAVR